MPHDTDRAGERTRVAATRPQRPPRTALRDLGDVLPDGSTIAGDDTTVVTGVSLSTQRILPGDLYAALPGSRVHGIDFVGDALEVVRQFFQRLDVAGHFEHRRWGRGSAVPEQTHGNNLRSGIHLPWRNW